MLVLGQESLGLYVPHLARNPLRQSELFITTGKKPGHAKPTKGRKKGTPEKLAEFTPDKKSIFSQPIAVGSRPGLPALEEMNQSRKHTHRYGPPMAQSAYSICKY